MPRFGLLFVALLLLPGCPSAALEDAPGCEGALLAAVDVDPSVRGPWPVGARTVEIGRTTATIHYPATPGSEEGSDALKYDIRSALPPSQQRAIPDADNPLQACDCYADLPLDDERGPYPVVVFIHGTAGWETQSLSQLTHWASRGFVVVSARYPGLFLGDLLSLTCPDEPSGEQDLEGDTDAILSALAAPSGELAFLDGKLDVGRIGLAGHSAGGNAVAGLGDREGVKVVVPMASAAPVVGTDRSVLFLGGLADDVVEWEATVAAYDETAGPRTLAGLEGAGHLAFADLCDFTNEAGRNLIEIAGDHSICGVEFAGALFDCDPAYLQSDEAAAITNWASTAAFEQGLKCSGPASFQSLAEAHSAVTVLREDP
jgi:dienelactone hydrolase